MLRHCCEWNDSLTALELAVMNKSQESAAKLEAFISEFFLTLSSLILEQEAIQSEIRKLIGLEALDEDEQGRINRDVIECLRA